MSSSSKANILYQYYQEHVQFLNNLIFTRRQIVMLFAFQQVVIISDLLLKIPTSVKVTQILSYLGISEILNQLVIFSNVWQYFIFVMISLLLIGPFYILTQILLKEKFHLELLKSEYRKYCENSMVNQIFRFILVSMEFMFLPILISFASKQSSTLTAALLIFFVALNQCAIQFHLLEIGKILTDSEEIPTFKVNFPNKLLDTFLLTLGLILVNFTSGIAPVIISIGCTFFRVVLTCILSYFPKAILKDFQYVLISNLLISIGVLGMCFFKEIYLSILFIVISSLVLHFVKTKLDQRTYREIKSEDESQKSIHYFSNLLWKEGKFAKIFKQLVFLSRQDHSFRATLLIEIIKSKCFDSEKKMRGSLKDINCESVIAYEEMLSLFIGNCFTIADKSINVFMLIQSKQPKPYIFNEEVQVLIQKIHFNKKIASEIKKINQFSKEYRFLCHLLFKDFYVDDEFIDEIENRFQQNIINQKEKQLKLKLYNVNCCTIFINILDQIGKIIQVSKNIPEILGYLPTDLVGVSINELMPYSIRPLHQEILQNYIEKYDVRFNFEKSNIQFYAYTRLFSIQEIKIDFNFILNYFTSFQMCGIFQKIQSRELILLDQFGFVEGFTKQIGKQFGLDELDVHNCKNYNLMPLIPCLIKYGQGDICVKTIFFKLRTLKCNELTLRKFDENMQSDDLQQMQYKAFEDLLNLDEQIVDAFFLGCEIENICVFSGRVPMKKIIIKSFDRIVNFDEILTKIIKYKDINYEPTDHTLESVSQVTQFLSYDDDFEANDIIETQFNVSFGFNPLFKKRDIKLSHAFISLSSSSLLQIKTSPQRAFEEDYAPTEKITAKFKPQLKQSFNFMPLLMLLSASLLILLVYDQLSFNTADNLMSQTCTNIVNLYWAYSIYLKTAFNPNQTYVKDFSQMKLFDPNFNQSTEPFQYQSFSGKILSINKFFLFNTQIPTNLDLIVSAIQTKNATLTALFQGEYFANFFVMVSEFREKILDTQNLWTINLTNMNFMFLLRFSFLIVGSISLIFFLIGLWFQYNKSKLQLEAFFKFERIDLQQKIIKMNGAMKRLEMKGVKWHLTISMAQYLKGNEINYLQFNSFNSNIAPKSRFDSSESKEKDLARKVVNSLLVKILVLVLVEGLFLMSYYLICTNQTNRIDKIPRNVDLYCKLLVVPNLQMADLIYPVPQDVLDSFAAINQEVLNQPIDYIPLLYPLFSQPPCPDCPFMNNLLATNYRSFYSTFSQQILVLKHQNSTNVTDLFYAADIVVKNIKAGIITDQNPIIFPIVFGYLFFLAIFYIFIILDLKKMKQENQRIQEFGQFYDEETFTRNKHMSQIFSIRA